MRVAAQWRRSGTEERFVAADPHEVYQVVSDVMSVGDRSDECRSAEWLAGGQAPGQVGARFRGRNRSGLARWSRVCEVVEAKPGVAFAFRTVPERLDLSRADSTTWRYDLVSQDGGTLVRHSYEITKMPKQPFRALYSVLLPQHRDMRPAMRRTLESLPASVNARRSTRPA